MLFLYVLIMVLVEEEEKSCVCVCVCVTVHPLLVETFVMSGRRILALFPLKKTQSDLRSAHLLQGPDCVRRAAKETNAV